MFDVRRQHPVAAFTKVIDIVKDNFITILLILFVGGTGGDETLFNITWLVGMAVVLLIWGVLSWLRFTYRVVDGELQIEQGVVVHKKLYMSKDRIQVIDITSGPVQRLFGLVSVQVKTAGSSSREAKLSAVTRAEAKQLKEQLRSDTAAENEGSGTVVSREMGVKDLVIAASTSGRFGISLSIVGTVFSQVDQIVTEQQMIDFVEGVIPSSVGVNMIAASVLLVIVISWLLTFFGTLFQYANFSVEIGEKELVISQGLFERKQLTVPYDRIQAIQIKEGIFRQPFGYVSLVLDSAGYGDHRGRSATLFPLLPRSRAADFIRKAVPEFDVRSSAVNPPLRALRRYIFRMILVSLLLILPAWWWMPFGAYAFLLLLPAVYWGYRQYRDAAVGITEDAVLLRYRLLGRTTAIARRHRIQAADMRWTLFQKRASLAHISATVASRSSGQQFTVRDVEAEDARGYFRWVSGELPDIEPEPGSEAPVLPTFG